MSLNCHQCHQSLQMTVFLRRLILITKHRWCDRAMSGSGSVLPQVPDVEIDPSGVFKYILIKLTVPNTDGRIEEKSIVRGFASCPYHSDINDKVTEGLQELKSNKTIRDWRTKVLGGGRISHDSSAKIIKVYGYSQGYGKADHQVTVDILKRKYKDYNVSWSDEGY